MLMHYANYIANLHVMAVAARAPVVLDRDLIAGGGLEAQAALHSMFIVGGPSRNSVAAQLLLDGIHGGNGGSGGLGHGVRFLTASNGSSFAVGGCTFKAGDGAGLVAALGVPGRAVQVDPRLTPR